jgi:hypothetical protein
MLYEFKIPKGCEENAHLFLEVFVATKIQIKLNNSSKKIMGVLHKDTFTASNKNIPFFFLRRCDTIKPKNTNLFQATVISIYTQEENLLDKAESVIQKLNKMKQLENLY